MRQALTAALLGNPNLSAASWDIRAAEARALQAGLLPNPELEAEAEEMAGGGERSGVDAAEVSLVLSQPIELGGKRAKRVRTARLEGQLVGWDYKAERRGVLAATAKAFVGLLAAQERVRLTGELVRLSEHTYQNVTEKVRAGKVSKVEGDKAQVELAMSRIELVRAQHELTSRRAELAATWGSRSATFDRVMGQLDGAVHVPPFEQLIPLLTSHPRAARWPAEVEHREAKLAQERAARVQDITLSAGVQHFNEDDGHAFIVGIGVPLPLFDRNQGGIREAETELAKAHDERRAAQVELRSELVEAYERLTTAHAEATALKQEVLPAAQAAFDAAGEGYRQGKFGYLDVLDAQRTLFEARQKLIDALAAYHEASADVEGLIGQSLESATSPVKQETNQ
ncbi:MAG: TolC family protein [Candidatus Brocadiae bacterium]|nr:TolC family protein [Candidatus Brocadiia bacterium]